jgi:hypothetical protein
VIAVGAATAAVTVTPAQAANFTVTNLNDSDAGSLRQAITDANAAPGADTITFAVVGTITLTGGELSVTDDLTITGPGADSLTISGNDSGRVVSIDSTVTAGITDVTIADGLAAATGAGIYNGGALTVEDATISGNSITFGYGGGIFNAGSLTVRNSTFFGNGGFGYGGAIAQLANATATVTGSTFVGNSSLCTFCYGGAILAGGGSSTMNVTNSTFVGNASGYQGGAIYTNATLTVTNSTFSGNSSANGGGIRSEFGNVTLQNSIVANSSAGGNCDATFGVISGLGNVSWPDATCPGSNVDPQLGALQDNGGPTETMALAPESPAVDAAVAADCPATDQRGVTRPQGDGCDIGAFELVQTVEVAIDVKPGSDSNSINLASRGVVPVAVLGATTFDANTVDASTVCFGDAEDAAQRVCNPAHGTSLEDVNGDAFLDLVLRFETRQTGIDPGDTEACLGGKRLDETSIEGCDAIRTT